MIKNDLCASCTKGEVCRNKDILYKFHKDQKKQLGIDITIDDCINFEDAMEDAVANIDSEDDPEF